VAERAIGGGLALQGASEGKGTGNRRIGGGRNNEDIINGSGGGEISMMSIMKNNEMAE